MMMLLRFAGVTLPGKLDEGVVAWHPPSLAAQGLLLGAARGARTVYLPWSQVRRKNARLRTLARSKWGHRRNKSAKARTRRLHANTCCL